MTNVEKFKDLNVEVTPFDYTYSDVKKILSTQLNWGFLPDSALDIINRNSYNLIETVDMLHKYKFLEGEELVEMLAYATGLPVEEHDYIRQLENLTDIANKLNIIVGRDPNGVDNHVYIGLHSIKSEPEILTSLAGRKTHFHYLLPLNFELLRNESYLETCKWDYYALFSRYMQYCLDNHATDIHFEVSHFEKRPQYRAIVRIGPDREECKLFKLTASMNSGLIRDVIAERSGNKGASSDLDSNNGVIVDIKDAFGNGKLSVRFDAAQVWGGYYNVCRLQEQKTISFAIDDLGFDEKSVKLLYDNTQKPSGLTLFTGKIRTGKNTTMNAVGNEIVLKEEMPSIMSLESPIEILCKFPQVDYGGDVDKLNSYVRLSKKMDLDFVLLNEIPNAEVAFAVRDLVNSSIHVMTTWHMNRLWHLPHKLFEYFGESYRDILSQVNLVCNQRLYKRQCPHCLAETSREKFINDPRIYNFLVEFDVYSLMVAKGCDKCNYTGFSKGDIVVLPEILKFTSDLVLELFENDRPYSMEKTLIREIRGTHFSLEKQIIYATSDGRLAPKEILTII